MPEREATESLSPTPLMQWHLQQGARMAPFAGYNMPIQYASIVAEHQATRQAATLFDISHMGRLRFEGPSAHLLLDQLLTRRVVDMRPGIVRYALLCNAEGGILDDVLLYYLESPSNRQYFLLVVNASNRSKILQWIQPHLADYPDVAFSDVTEATAMISIQGPQAARIVGKLFAPEITQLKYFRGRVTDQMSKPCIISRTGYTGEDGFELIVRGEDAPRVWENLLLAGRDVGIQPAGLGARDTLRLEAGMPLYGHEISETIDPLAAGLAFAVNLQGRTFIGSEALAEASSRPPTQRRVGVRVTGRRAAREGATFFDQDNRAVGVVTSGTFSPTLQTPIAMGYLAAELAVEGESIEVDIRGSRTTATLVSLPFYNRSK